MATYSGYEIDSKVRNPQLKEMVKEIMDISAGHDHDGANSKSVVGGTVSDKAVTNAKLADDVKVGSLAAFTTTAKTNVQGAVNELDAAIGDIATLTTTAKTSTVAAINEIDANVGDVATLLTTSKEVVGAINELQTGEAAEVTLTGVQTLTNKTLTSPILTTAKIADGGDGLTITSANQTNAAAVATVPDIGDAADEFVMKDTAQTLTAKHLTSPHLTTPLIEDGDAGVSITSADQTNAAPTVTIPDIGDAADSFVMNDTSATLTNKTLTSPVLTTPIVVTTGSITDAGGAPYVTFVESTTPVNSVKITNADTTVSPIIQSTGETNIPLKLMGNGSGNVQIGAADAPTKILDFELSSATAGFKTTLSPTQSADRVLTLPDATDTLVGRDTTDTLTLKTLTTPVIASLYQDAGKTLTVTMPAATDTLVGKATTDTLTNKTLTSPVLTTPVIDDGDENVTITSANQTDSGATVTIPNIVDSADTFAMVDTAQTLTNKTIDSASNPVKNIVLAYAGSITRAEIIAGKVLVAATAGRQIKVLSVKMGVVGAFDGGAGTSFILKDTSSTVTILTALKAALTNGAKISTEGLAIANVTEGAGMTTALTAADGIAVVADADFDAGTSIDIVIQYMYV